MEETEDYSETENLEEGLEDVSGGEAAEEESKKGGKSSVCDSFTYEGNSPIRSLLSGPLRSKVSVGDMYSVVHAQTDGEHDVHSGEDVNCYTPEVKEPDNIHQSDDDHDYDNETDEDITEEEESDDGHTKKGEEKVPLKFLANNFVSLPGGINLAVTEEVWRGRALYDLSECGLSWDVLLWS